MDERQAEYLHAELERRVADLSTDATFRAFLRGAATFRKYSWTNTLLIWVQAPEATAVKGFRAWQELGRQVRKGETAIRIMAPRPYTKTVERDGEEVEERRTAFGWASVFDIAQTDPIPGHPRPYTVPPMPPVGGDPEAARAVIAAIESHLVGEHGITVQRTDDHGHGDAGGWWHKGRREVYVRPAAPCKEAMVLIHEAAHALAEAEVDGYAANEVVAQAVAYIAGTALGLEVADFSAAYVARWLVDDPAGFRKGMATTVRLAGHLIAVAEQAVAPVAMEAAA